VIAAPIFALALVAVPASAGGNGAKQRPAVKELLSGLSSPRGLALNCDADLVIGQGAFGPPGPVLVYDLHGKDKGTSFPVSDPANLTDVTVSPRDCTGWGIGPDTSGTPQPPEGEEGPGPDVHLYHQLADGTIVDVLNITAYQKTDPDPVDHDDPPNPTESNPYAMTATWRGDILIADAAGNDVIRVTPDGHASTMARFDLQSVSTAQVPPGLPGLPPSLPPTLPAEAVPTSITQGPDGAIYVGELKGFPFQDGSSNIWRIKPNADGAWCSVNTPDPTHSCRLYDMGFTGIQDLAFNPHNGKMYVYELAVGGVFAFEPALDPTSGASFPPAILLEVNRNWKGEKRREIAAGQLSQPGGIVFSGGTLYATDHVFTNGRLLKINT